MKGARGKMSGREAGYEIMSAHACSFFLMSLLRGAGLLSEMISARISETLSSDPPFCCGILNSSQFQVAVLGCTFHSSLVSGMMLCASLAKCFKRCYRKGPFMLQLCSKGCLN